MKKTILLSLIAVLAISCSGFLEEHPATQFSRDQAYSTNESAQATVNACYAYLSNYRLYGQKLQIVPVSDVRELLRAAGILTEENCGQNGTEGAA